MSVHSGVAVDSNPGSRSPHLVARLYAPLFGVACFGYKYIWTSLLW